MSATRFLVTGVAVAALACAVTAPAQAANIISTSPAGDITAVSSGRLSFTSSSGSIACNATLEGGMFTLNLVEAFGSEEGAAVTEWRTANCTEPFGGAIATRALAFSWGVRTDSFLGTLPNIAGLHMTILGARLVTSGGLLGECLYAGDIPLLITFPPEAGGNVVRVLTNELTRQSGGGFCPAVVHASGSFLLTPRQSLTLRTQAQPWPALGIRTIGFGGAEGRTTLVITATSAVTIGSLRLVFGGRNYIANADCIGRTLAVNDRCTVTIEVRPAATRQEELNIYDNATPANIAGAIHLRP